MRRLTRRQRISAIVLTVVALCFITLDLGGGSLRDAHSGVRGSLGSLYRGTDVVLGPARRWVQGVPSAGTNTGTIESLRKQNVDLRTRIAKLESDERTGRALKQLQRAADGSGNQLLPARVTAFGPGSGFDWTITVDAGTRSGVRAGQTVSNGAALVGRVLHADGDSSVVLLAADPGSGVGVRDTRSGELGVVTGQGADGFTFAPLKPDSTVRVGDRLLTGPTGSTRFVTGLAVGTVTAVRTAGDGSTHATVRPSTSPTAVDVVGIVVGQGSGLAEPAPRSPVKPR